MDTSTPAPEFPEAHAPQPAKRSLFFKIGGPLLLTVVLLLLLEGACSVTLAFRGAQNMQPLAEEAHSRYDADLGWSHVPSRVLADAYGPGTNLTINSQGFRALH